MFERARGLPVALRQRATDLGEDGASATEYAVIVAIVVAALVLIGTVFTDVLSDLWNGMVGDIRSNFISGGSS
jgi:Flp pilus assembly pilin Flp